MCLHVTYVLRTELKFEWIFYRRIRGIGYEYHVNFHSHDVIISQFCHTFICNHKAFSSDCYV
jgi:hypothetical protein